MAVVHWNEGVFTRDFGEIIGRGDPDEICRIVQEAIHAPLTIGRRVGTAKEGFSWPVVPLVIPKNPVLEKIDLSTDQLFKRVGIEELHHILARISSIHTELEHEQVLHSIKRGDIPKGVSASDAAMHAISGYYEGGLTRDEMVSMLLYSYVIASFPRDEYCIEPLDFSNTKVDSYFRTALAPYFSDDSIDTVIEKLEEIAPIERKLVLCVELIRDLEEIQEEESMSDLEFRKHFLQFTLGMVEGGDRKMLLALPPGLLRLLHSAQFTDPVECIWTLGYSSDLEKYDVCENRIVGVPSAVSSLPEMIHGRFGDGIAFYTHDMCHAYCDSANPWRKEFSKLAEVFGKIEEKEARQAFVERDFPFFGRAEVISKLFSRRASNDELFWVSTCLAYVQAKRAGSKLSPCAFFQIIVEEILFSRSFTHLLDSIKGVSSAIKREGKDNIELAEMARELEQAHERLVIKQVLLDLQLELKGREIDDLDKEKISALFQKLPLEMQYAVYGEVFTTLEFHRTNPRAGELAFWGADGHRCSSFQRVKAISAVVSRLTTKR